MIDYETQIYTKSPFWGLVMNSAKTDALTTLFMSPKRSLIQDYRRLWPSEIPICDAVMKGLTSYGLLPEGFEIVDGTVTSKYGITVNHTFGFNSWDGHVFDPTVAQFFDPNPDSPGEAIYRMMDYNPGRVLVDPTIGLGILYAPYYEVQGFAYEFY